MNEHSGMRIAAVLAAALVAAAFAAQSSPARTASAAEGSSASTTFVSKNYGYTVAIPGPQWVAYDAAISWSGDFPLGVDPGLDIIFDSHDRKFIAAAMPLSAGTTLRTWTAHQATTVHSVTAKSGAPFCRKARAFRDTTLGGAPAREFQYVCLGYDTIVVNAVHRGRGYVFQFVSPTPNTAASDRGTFDAGRRSFRFTS
jgi:hypothetical protein